MEVRVVEVEAETFAPLMPSVSVKASTATVGAVCVSESRPTEVMEPANLMKVTVAEVDAAYFFTGGAVSVGGSRPMKVAELAMLAVRVVTEVEAETVRQHRWCCVCRWKQADGGDGAGGADGDDSGGV